MSKILSPKEIKKIEKDFRNIFKIPKSTKLRIVETEHTIGIRVLKNDKQ